MTPAARPRRVVDLFAGLGGWSAPWRAAGHDVVTLDLDPRFGTDIVADVLEVRASDFPWRPDVVLASPPCEGFSVARLGTNWTGSKNEPLRPRTPKAALATRIVEATLALVGELAPEWHWIENPCGAMRRLGAMRGIRRTTVTFCKYGKHYQKRTDLWGRWPSAWRPRGACDAHPRRGTEEVLWSPSAGRWWPSYAEGLSDVAPDARPMTFVRDSLGYPCHEAASRGARTGVQGLASSADRALIPAELARDVMDAVLAADADAARAPTTLF